MRRFAIRCNAMNSFVGEMMKTAMRAAQLMLAAAALAAAANAVSPRRIPWFKDWSGYIEQQALKYRIPLAGAHDVRRMVESGSHIVLDARPESDYLEGQIPGAVSVPYDEVMRRWDELSAWLTPGIPVLTYCSGPDCDDALLLARFLKERGRTNVVLFAEGYKAWKAHQEEAAP